jgi:hypothetical protein
MATSVSRKPLLARIFHRLPPSSGEQVPFRIRCSCGQTISGVRKRQALELICPKCANKLFVLPRSAWPPVTPAVPPPPEQMPAIPQATLLRSSRKVWLLPLWVGLFALLTAVWFVWVYGPQVARSARQDKGRTLAEHMAAAHEALEKGDFERAVFELEGGTKAWQRENAPPPAEQQAAHYRLLEQTRLLTELAPVSLEQALAWSEEQEKLPPAQRTDIKVHLPHRVFILDAAIRAPAPQLLNEARPYRLDYQLAGTTLPVLLELTTQEKLLKLVPLEKAQRWLFAVRLDNIQLLTNEEHPRGQWVIRFEPNSAVLLTDARLFRTWRLQADQLPPAVLERQDKLLVSAPQQPQLWEDPSFHGMTRVELQTRLGPTPHVSRQFWKRNYLEQWRYEEKRICFNLHSANGTTPRVAARLRLPK